SDRRRYPAECRSGTGVARRVYPESVVARRRTSAGRLYWWSVSQQTAARALSPAGGNGERESMRAAGGWPSRRRADRSLPRRRPSSKAHRTAGIQIMRLPIAFVFALSAGAAARDWNRVDKSPLELLQEYVRIQSENPPADTRDAAALVK